MKYILILLLIVVVVVILKSKEQMTDNIIQVEPKKPIEEKPIEEKTIEKKPIEDIKKDKLEKEPAYPKDLDLKDRNYPLTYSENNYKENLFPELGSLGDNKLAYLQKHRGDKNKQAMDRASRMNKYTNINYFSGELKEHANSIWWDDDFELEKKF